MTEDKELEVAADKHAYDMGGYLKSEGPGYFVRTDAFKAGARWAEERRAERMRKLERVAEAARQTVIAAERMKNTSGGIHRISLAIAALDDDK